MTNQLFDDTTPNEASKENYESSDRYEPDKYLGLLMAKVQDMTPRELLVGYHEHLRKRGNLK